MSSKSALAIYYESDGYQVAGRNVMGRHSAGAAFLKAAAKAYSGEELWAYTSGRESAELFAEQVRAVDSSVKPRWCQRHKLDVLQKLGTLFYPGPDIAPLAGLRLRGGVSSFSLCGVTHTTASHRAMDSLSTTLRSPLMPWDAIICTSTAVKETLDLQRVAEEEYLKWRFGPQVRYPDGPKFPVIPLGVHVDDFTISPEERAEARAQFGITPEEVVIVFVGRLSFHAKAHPDAMHLALESVARTGRKITLIQCGWFENDKIAAGFRNGARASAPNVQTLFVDGRRSDAARRSWAAADIFISLADNIQETFGLTPLEAMASGLPVIVADWNGYKDTIRDGVDGFRVPTLMPPPGAGDVLAARYEAGTINYDRYCGYACSFVALDMRHLIEKLGILVDDSDLRMSMGRVGQQRAKERYDWTVVFSAYEDLWAELNAIRRTHIRRSEAGMPAPPHMPGRADPFLSFSHYASRIIGPATLVVRTSRIDELTYASLLKNPLFGFAAPILPDVALVERILSAVTRPKSIRDLASRLKTNELQLIRTIAVLAKMGLIAIE